jgi:hypothetical protein
MLLQMQTWQTGLQEIFNEVKPGWQPVNAAVRHIRSAQTNLINLRVGEKKITALYNVVLT